MKKISTKLGRERERESSKKKHSSNYSIANILGKQKSKPKIIYAFHYANDDEWYTTREDVQYHSFFNINNFIFFTVFEINNSSIAELFLYLGS